MAERSKILIVDDEPFNVDLLEQQLEELGYETVSAANGQEALDQVAAEAPDLILLDVMMPIMDGFTVCHILKDNEETRLIPIVIMTALGAVEDRILGERYRLARLGRERLKNLAEAVDIYRVLEPFAVTGHP